MQWRISCQAFAAGLSALSLCGAGPLSAQQIGVTVNGEPVVFRGAGPQRVEGRVLVPVRGVLEKLGAEIGWNPTTRLVVASNAKVDIQLKLGERRAVVNGKEVMLDVPAQMIAGSTMVPLRFLGEALGVEVGWNNQTRTVEIVTSGQPDSGSSPARPPANAGPEIIRLTHNTAPWFSAGQTLKVTLLGTPGGEAAFRIPGLTDTIPMKEVEAGRYQGEWVVPKEKALYLTEGAVIGSLKVGGKSAPLLQSGQPISVDSTPPKVRERAPEPDTTVDSRRPNIYAVYEDEGSGINRDAIRLLLNGKNVTPEANVTSAFISYTPETLPAGTQTALLILVDRAGNRTEKTWKFVTAPKQAAALQEVTHNADRPLKVGDLLRVEATGAPGSRVVYSVGQVIQNRAMREARPGVYTAEYRIQAGDDITNGRVLVTLTTPEKERFSASAEKPLTIATGRPRTPEITSPGKDEKLAAREVVIKGKGTPNTKVQVKVDYVNRVLGVVGLKGTLADVTVNVDKDGNWQTEPINLRGLLAEGGSVEYTISATAVNDAGEKSETAQLKLRSR